MRKVAAEANRSLGNVQYHFKDKTALMGGLAEYYFAECMDLLVGYARDTEEGADPESGVRGLISFYMDHLDHLTDMCRIFRELWALSTRSPELHEQLITYYRMSVEQFADLFAPMGYSSEASARVASLLIPYFEGYSIAGEALPLSKDEMTDLLVRVCLAERTSSATA